MAVVTLVVPDEIFTDYGSHGMSPNKAMQKQLERFREFPPDERLVILSRGARQRIEGLIGLPIEDTDKFATWVEKLASLRVGGVDIKLSETQRKRLVGEADHWNKPGETHQDYIDKRIRAIIEQAIGR